MTGVKHGIDYPHDGDTASIQQLPFTPSAGNLWAQPGVSDFEFIAH